VVLWKDEAKKLVIMQRGTMVELGGKEVYRDYGATIYPEDLQDELIYFNHADITKVIFEGFRDDAETAIVKQLNEFAQKHRGDE
jgi:hypothetical protein